MRSKKIAFSCFQGDCEFNYCILGTSYVLCVSNNCKLGGKFAFAFIASSHLNVGLRYVAASTQKSGVTQISVASPCKSHKMCFVSKINVLVCRLGLVREAL